MFLCVKGGIGEEGGGRLRPVTRLKVNKFQKERKKEKKKKKTMKNKLQAVEKFPHSL